MEHSEGKRGKKLYYYLSRFTEKDLQDFHAYLSSSLLGNSPQFARMLLIIQEKVLNTERENIDADLFKEEFSPEQELDANKVKYIRIRIVQMHEKLLEFISFMDYRADPNAKDIHMLKALYTRGWDKYFVKIHAEVEKKPPFKKAGEYHIYRLWRAIVLNDYMAEAQSQHLLKSNQTLAKILDETIVYLKIKYITVANSNRYLQGNIIPHLLLKEFEQLSEDPRFDQIHEITLYKTLNSLTKQTPQSHIYKCTAIIDWIRTGEIEDQSEAMDTVGLLFNFLTFQIQNKIEQFQIILTDLYKAIIAIDDFKNKERMGKSLYRNITMRLCRMNDQKSAMDITEKWKNRILGQISDEYYWHNLSIISFSKKEYRKTIEILSSRVKLYEEPVYAINSRLNICKSLWELGDYQWLDQNLEAFRISLRRVKGIPAKEIEAIRQFVNYLKKLSLAKTGTPDQYQPKVVQLKQEFDKNKLGIKNIWISQILDREIKNFLECE